MLPAYIIEELKQRERARREEQRAPRPRLDVELPLGPAAPERDEEPVERGVEIIQIG